MKHFTLVAFGVERRHAATAIFQGTHLEDLRLKCLPTEVLKAIGSVSQMASKLLQQTRPDFVVIKVEPQNAGERTKALCGIVRDCANTAGVPIVEIDDLTLLCAYGQPPLTQKVQLCSVARTLWPDLITAKSRVAATEAATAGLYVQTERLFSFHQKVVA